MSIKTQLIRMARGEEIDPAAIEQVVDETLAKLGLTMDTAHLAPLKSKFEDELAWELRAKDLELPFKHIQLPTLNMQVGGNAGGIASVVGYNLWARKWRRVTMTQAEIIDYLKTHPDVGCYEKDRYGEPHPVNRQRVIDTEYGSTSRHQGIGSQSSIHETTVELKMDDQGNLMLNKFTLVYD